VEEEIRKQKGTKEEKKWIFITFFAFIYLELYRIRIGRIISQAQLQIGFYNSACGIGC
jgi:hypothetical protein